MINICFREWLFKEAEKIPLPQVDKTCQTTCASATVVWLVKLLKNWDRILSPVEVEKISPFIIDKNNPAVEGLQVNLDNFKFNSGRLGKVVDIIPQEDEVRGAQSTGAKPISGSITVRPRKLDIGVAHGNYVDKNMAVKIPYQAIENVKSIGGCALTCLHMSGGQVHAKTVGGYKKTLLYKTNQDLFYNNTLEQYFRAAISALYDNCRKGSNLDHYAIRLNGTTDIKHYANDFILDVNVIGKINKYLKSLNTKSVKDKNPINFKMVDTEYVKPGEKGTFFDIFNKMWQQTTSGINCEFNPTFLQFYDYTALGGLMQNFAAKKLPANYHVTFSVKEGNLKEVLEALSKGLGVALPLWLGGVKKNEKMPLPAFWYPEGIASGKGYRVVDGDAFDARFLDKKTYGIPEDEGYVIGLRAKGKLEDIESFDSGFAERMLLNYKMPQIEQLREFGKKYPVLRVNSPYFDIAKKDFMTISGSYMNPRFEPNDPAVNKIILEQIIYTLRRSDIKINGLGKLLSKDFYDAQEKKGVKALVNIKDIDYDKMHSTDMSGTSAKTEKGDVSMKGTSAKVEKGAKLRVKTNQMNMLPHTTFAALRNQLEKLKKLKKESFSEWLSHRN